MQHTENQRKKTKSSITLFELLERIIQFEGKIKTDFKMTKCLSGLKEQSAKLLSES